jgi:hypothetical protein
VVLIEDGVVQVDTLYVGAYQDDSLLSGEEEDPPYILNDALPDVLNRAISVPLSCTDQDAEWGVDDDAQAIGMAVEDGCLVCEGCGPGDYAVTLTACNCAGCDEYLYEFTVMEPVAVAAFTPWGMGAAFCGLLAMGAAAIRRRQ